MEIQKCKGGKELCPTCFREVQVREGRFMGRREILDGGVMEVTGGVGYLVRWGHAEKVEYSVANGRIQAMYNIY
jgi:hypothetical protein